MNEDGFVRAGRCGGGVFPNWYLPARGVSHFTFHPVCVSVCYNHSAVDWSVQISFFSPLPFFLHGHPHTQKEFKNFSDIPSQISTGRDLNT